LSWDAFQFAFQSDMPVKPFSLSRRLHDLVTFLNTLEAFPRLSWRVRRNCGAYLGPFRHVAISEAQSAFEQFDARWWEIWK
jgi:hypothetical protein